jgi:hypothetical protein
MSDQNDSKASADSENHNETVEVIRTVTSASARSTARVRGKSIAGGVSATSTILSPEVIALTRDSETSRIDSKLNSGPKPSDLGEHQPIPLDTISAVVAVADERVDIPDYLPEDEENE